MKYYRFQTLVLLISLNIIIDCYSQTDDKSQNPFSIIINPGITYFIDGDIYRRDGLLANIGAYYMELGLYYMLGKKSELGLSIGKNNFTNEETIYFTPGDTSGYTTDKLFRNYQWAAINFTQYLKQNWFVGLKFGTMEPDYGGSETLLGLYFGKEIVRVQNFFSSFKIEYLARARLSNFAIHSNQINLTIGIGFRF